MAPVTETAKREQKGIPLARRVAGLWVAQPIGILVRLEGTLDVEHPMSPMAHCPSRAEVAGRLVAYNDADQAAVDRAIAQWKDEGVAPNVRGIRFLLPRMPARDFYLWLTQGYSSRNVVWSRPLDPVEDNLTVCFRVHEPLRSR